MARQIPEAYTRDEWAYLITFLDSDNLRRPFEQSFGQPVESETGEIVRVIRRRGNIGIWLPGNVSLLGPLTMILLSLTGNRIRMKGATGAEDLTGVFLEFARSHLPEGALLKYLENDVSYDVFERDDARNQEMAKEADVRIAFGSDQAVKSILELDHPLGSTGIAFAELKEHVLLKHDHYVTGSGDFDSASSLLALVPEPGQELLAQEPLFLYQVYKIHQLPAIV